MGDLHSGAKFAIGHSFPARTSLLPDLSLHQKRKDSGASLNDSADAGVVETDTPVDNEQRQIAIGHLRDKIKKTEEAIRREQAIMDGYVNEFSRIDPLEVNKKPKLKSQFEAKNNKSKQTIDNLQRKIEKYKAKIKTLEHGGGEMTVLKGHVKERLREMKEGFLDTFTGAATFMRRAKHPNNEGDASSLTEMEIGDRPAKLVEGAEESAEKTIGDVQFVPLPPPENVLIRTTMEDLKERVQGLSEEYINVMKRVDELKQAHAEARKEMQIKFQSDLQLVRKENEMLKKSLEKETNLRETAESQYQDLCALHHDLQSDLGQLQERLGFLEYRTGERFAETDERMGSLDLKLSQMQHDRENESEDYVFSSQGAGSSPKYMRVLVAKPLSVLLNVISGLIALISGLFSPFRLCLRGKWRWAWALGAMLLIVIFIFFF